jgi:23S rRNA (adenine1618-N6)-methyltransferase
VTGLDIGCGANLVYPLLGAALCGWRFIGADVTPVALAWAARNLGANPQLAGLIELRRVAMQPEQQTFLASKEGLSGSSETIDKNELSGAPPAIAGAAPAPVATLSPDEGAGSGIVSGALKRGERIAFCMCNPPFFESLEEAGRNPATAYGGTAAEMVYPGGGLEGHTCTSG